MIPRATCVRVAHSSINLQNYAFMTIQRGKNRQDGRDIYLLKVFFTQGVSLELEADTQPEIEDIRDFIEAASNGMIGGDREEHIYVPKGDTETHD